MDNWRKRKDHSGFTLMEMLIVVAMIAVLVAISIPTFTNILEKSRESTDLANVRSAYAEVLVAASLDDSVNAEKTVALKQKVDGWQSADTVRRVSYGVGCEKVFPLHSPNVAMIETVRKGQVRRAKLYYLRDRVGKAAKIKEKV